MENIRKIIGILQMSIFFLFGFWLISFKFQSETSYTDTYWIAGVVYILLGILLWKLGNTYGWFSDHVSDKPVGNKASNFTIPFVFIIGLMSILQSKDRLLNIDSILPFVLLIVPLASLLGYVGYLAQSTMRPDQFKGSMYKKSLVVLLYLGSFLLGFSLLISATYSLPSEYNENRTYELVETDCTSDFISVDSNDGIRQLYYPKQSKAQQIECESATKVEVRLQMNSIGIDYFDQFEYLK